MSTRGFLGFVAEGQEKITYNHSDSHPDGLGRDVLHFVRQLVKEGPEALASAKRRAAELRVVTDETPITPEDIERLRPWTNTSVGRAMHLAAEPPDSWYQLLRGTQGDPDAILTAGCLEDASGFPLDSLFAEWGYMVDFDGRKVEVYRGSQHQPPTGGRWVGKADDEEMQRQRARINDSYYPVNLVAELPFDLLPSDEEFYGLCRYTED